MCTERDLEWKRGHNNRHHHCNLIGRLMMIICHMSEHWHCPWCILNGLSSSESMGSSPLDLTKSMMSRHTSLGSSAFSNCFTSPSSNLCCFNAFCNFCFEVRAPFRRGILCLTAG